MGVGGGGGRRSRRRGRRRRSTRLRWVFISCSFIESLIKPLKLAFIQEFSPFSASDAPP